MKTRIIHTKFWKDDYVAKLSRAEKLAFIYLLSNENVGMSGMYELNDLEMKMWLGLTDTEIEDTKKKFHRDGKIFFKDGWVKLVNHNKYNSYGRGESQETALQRELSLIPREIKEFFDTSVGTSVGSVPTLGINHKSKIINKKSENKKNGSLKIFNSAEFVKVLKTQFPDVNVEGELDKAQDWLKSKGRVYRDYSAFVRNWLRKAQEFKKQRKGGVLDARRS